MPPSVAQRLTVIAGDIKLAHSVFALPFALLATFLAAAYEPTAAPGPPTGSAPRPALPGWGPLGLIVACMFFARTYAMLANRYADRHLDAANPRTAGRALPSGRLRPAEALAALILSAAALAIGAALFGVLYGNWWPLIFCPLVLLWLAAYPLMKRYTVLSHFVLGAALGMSPLAAALAIRPAYLGEPTLWWLAGFIVLWVGGFDVIYALQDIEVDQREGLRSIPARMGPRRALLVARAAHVGALVLLTAAYFAAPRLEWLFFIGVAVVGVMLVIEHHAASAGRFTMAFFTANGVISLVLGGLGIADVLI